MQRRHSTRSGGHLVRQRRKFAAQNEVKRKLCRDWPALHRLNERGFCGFRVVLGECIDWFAWQVLGGTVLNDIPFCIGSEIPFRRIEND